MSKRLPWFPLLVSDFLGDETVKVASNRALGVYLKLLCHQWVHHSIPADSTGLSRIAHETPSIFARLWPEIRDKFQAAGRGRLINPKLESVRQQQLSGSRALRGAWQKSGKNLANAGKNLANNRQFHGTDVEVDIKTTTTRDGKEKAGIPRETWLTPYYDGWIAAYGGNPAVGPLVKALKPLEQEHGPEKTLQHWRSYLAKTEARFASAPKFAQTFGSWGNGDGRNARDAYLKPRDVT